MIKFALSCDKGHQFDSWFQSSDAFDALAGSGHLACAVCGSVEVKKSLMAPAVPPKGREAVVAPDAGQGPLSNPASEAEAALAALRKKVEETSDYVGLSFASEARAMHEGDIPERPIYGEAKGDEARKLIEDGIPVLPLPYGPKRGAN